MQWQDLSAPEDDKDSLTVLLFHCRSGKSSVISMLMIGTETCEDQDN